MTFVQNKRDKTGASNVQWYIAIYVRLSKEDGDKLESDSIQNQKGIIEQHIKYLENQGEIIASVEVYSDDGYPGGNFDRPEYKRMIADIEAGKINCIIFKDDCVIKARTPQPLENRHFLRISAKFRAILRPQRTAHIIGNS